MIDRGLVARPEMSALRPCPALLPRHCSTPSVVTIVAPLHSVTQGAHRPGWGGQTSVHSVSRPLLLAEEGNLGACCSQLRERSC
mmetsp:Transcript_12571/g.32176  ORF Transcript_12571/g.32176 Transcript_12571/m.32176 type:complete len:84 (+) Transcript_12571:69-320(+)